MMYHGRDGLLQARGDFEGDDEGETEMAAAIDLSFRSRSACSWKRLLPERRPTEYMPFG